MLLPGTFLGVWNLISISSRRAAESVSASWLQAHGHAQVFGWVGSLILGIGFHSLPKLRRSGPFALAAARVLKEFPSAPHLASWAGVCPGKNQSAGKRRSGKMREGNPWLRRALCQAAWPASRTNGAYFSAQYHRLAARRGRKRAIIAVAHSPLVTAYCMLKERRNYHELGADYFDRLNTEGLKRYLLRRLARLGLCVSNRFTDVAPPFRAACRAKAGRYEGAHPSWDCKGT